MTKDPNLVLRGLVWGLRMAIPKKLRDLRAQAGETNSQREIWRTTGKSDLSEARIEAARLKHVLLSQFRDEGQRLEQHLARVASPRTTPTFAQLEAAAFRFQHEMAADLVRERMRLPSQRQLDAEFEAAHRRFAQARALRPDVELDGLPEAWDLLLAKNDDPASRLEEQRAYLLKDLRHHLMRGNYDLVDWAIQDAAHRNHWEIPRDSDAYKSFGLMLARAWIQQLDAADRNYLEGPAAQVASNVYSLNSRATTTAGTARTPATHMATHELLSTFVDRYLTEQHPGETRATNDQRRAAIRTFTEVCGDRPPHDYIKQDVARFKEALRKLPANATREFKGKAAPEVIALLPAGAKTQSIKTINDKLNKLYVFGAWLGANVDEVEASTFRTTALKATKGEKIRVRGFTDAEVVKILNSMPFIGCQSERKQLEPGTYRVRDWRFWIPMIAAFSGARLNEIAQLTVDDVVTVGSIPVLRIHDEGENQSVKTRTSVREIPIHSALLAVGFVEFVEGVRAAGKVALFNGINLDVDKRRSTHAGRTFRKLLVRLGVKGTERGGIHRFRHTVADRLRLAGYANHDFAPILGHESGIAPMTAKYGDAAQTNLKRSREIIESIRYEGLDLGILKS